MMYYLLVCGHWAEADARHLRGAGDYVPCERHPVRSGAWGVVATEHQRILAVAAVTGL